MQTLINIIIIVFGILQIILFFKIWGMTNDIRKIREKYFLSSDSKKSIESTQQTELNVLTHKIIVPIVLSQDRV